MIFNFEKSDTFLFFAVFFGDAKTLTNFTLKI